MWLNDYYYLLMVFYFCPSIPFIDKFMKSRNRILTAVTWNKEDVGLQATTSD